MWKIKDKILTVRVNHDDLERALNYFRGYYCRLTYGKLVNYLIGEYIKSKEKPNS